MTEQELFQELAKLESNHINLQEYMQKIMSDDINLRSIGLFDQDLSDNDVMNLMIALEDHQAVAQQIRIIILCEIQLTIPPDVSMCPNLEILILTGNHLTNPPDVSTCLKLKLLDIGNNLLITSPDISRCTELFELRLEYNQLATAPDVSTCPDLTFIDLCGNLLIEAPDVSACLKLHSLHLQNNRIKNFEISSQLSRIQELLIDNNPLGQASIILLFAFDYKHNLPRNHLTFDVSHADRTSPRPRPLTTEMIESHIEAPAIADIISMYRTISLLLMSKNIKLHDIAVHNIMSFLSPLSNKNINKLNIFASQFEENSEERKIIDNYKNNIEQIFKPAIGYKIIKDAQKELYALECPRRAILTQFSKEHDTKNTTQNIQANQAKQISTPHGRIM